MSQDGDIPLLINIRSGNESDKKQFAEIITSYQKQINWETIYIADSALYTANNLHKLGNTPWISRVPLNNKKAKLIHNTLIIRKCLFLYKSVHNGKE